MPANLSQDDINAIAKAITEAIASAHLPQEKALHPDCRFSDIEIEDMRETVNFVKNFNAAMADSRTVVRRFVLLLVLTTASGLLYAGGWTKITDALKKTVGVP